MYLFLIFYANIKNKISLLMPWSVRWSMKSYFVKFTLSIFFVLMPNTSLNVHIYHSKNLMCKGWSTRSLAKTKWIAALACWCLWYLDLKKGGDMLDGYICKWDVQYWGQTTEVSRARLKSPCCLLDWCSYPVQRLFAVSATVRCLDSTCDRRSSQWQLL